MDYNPYLLRVTEKSNDVGNGRRDVTQQVEKSVNPNHMDQVQPPTKLEELQKQHQG